MKLNGCYTVFTFSVCPSVWFVFSFLQNSNILISCKFSKIVILILSCFDLGSLIWISSLGNWGVSKCRHSSSYQHCLISISNGGNSCTISYIGSWITYPLVCIHIHGYAKVGTGWPYIYNCCHNCKLMWTLVAVIAYNFLPHKRWNIQLFKQFHKPKCGQILWYPCWHIVILKVIILFSWLKFTHDFKIYYWNNTSSLCVICLNLPVLFGNIYFYFCHCSTPKGLNVR